MKTKSLFTLAVTAALITSASATITMDWVNIGNAGNVADTTTYGAVAYAYQIGKYEVTNAQYGAFLSAKGSTNSNGIYNSIMSSYGITQSGSSSSFIYSVTSGFEQKPVVYVSWYDAARFANWMMNGQGNGDMETGAYTLNGNSGTILKSSGASVWLPSENEWYKAAYYKAANTSYSLYPNGQNTITQADANYGSIASTDVGTYSADPSSYGTFDQGGNVWEWNDKVSDSSRGNRGGSWDFFDFGLTSSFPIISDPTKESKDFGFRVASSSIAAVPEPSGLLTTAALVASSLLLRRRSKNSL
jgi:sulfatase modifying factor 1